MKSIKMLGLAVVAALALTAVAGATSASAAILCKTNTYKCSASNVYPAGTVIEAQLRPGTQFRMYYQGVGSTACRKGSFTANTTSAGGFGEFTGVEAQVTSSSFSECTGGTYHASLGKISLYANAWWSKGGLQLEVNGAWGKCLYAAPAIVFHGGAPATGVESGERQLLAQISGVCPKLTEATAEWEFVKPSPMYYAYE